MTKETKGKIVNLAEFYALTGVPQSTVRNKYVPEGMPGVEPGAGHGDSWKIDARTAIKWLIDRKARELAGVEESDDGDEVVFDEDRRLKRLRGDNLAFELARKQSEVIPIQIAAGICREIALTLGQSMDAMPSSLADDLSDLDDPAEIKKVLSNYVREVRQVAVERTKERLSSVREQVFS